MFQFNNHKIIFFSLLICLVITTGHNLYGQTLVFQDFEVGTPVDYILKDESNGGTVFSEDVSQVFSAEDYCGRLQISDLDPADGLDFANVQDTRFFGINDIDGVDSYPVTRDIVSMNWDNIAINPNSIITVGSFIAEGDSQDNLEDWDTQGNFTRVRFEYSFDNTIWTTIFSIVGDPAGDPTNTRPVFDSNNDGTPDSPIIEVDENFAELEGTFETGTNSMVSIRIFIENLTGTDEDIAFDNFTISQEDVVVPVELSEFEISLQDCESVDIEWKTESEINNYGFYIERSNGRDPYKTIGFIEGHEFSNSRLEYSYNDVLDGFQHVGYLFYRLKQVDLNGNTSYSNIRSIQYNCEDASQSFEVFPNPSRGNIFVDLTNVHVIDGSYLIVENNLSQKVDEQIIDSGTKRKSIDLSSYNSGIYLVKLLDPSKRVINSKKIIVLK